MGEKSAIISKRDVIGLGVGGSIVLLQLLFINNVPRLMTKWFSHLNVATGVELKSLELWNSYFGLIMWCISAICFIGVLLSVVQNMMHSVLAHSKEEEEAECEKIGVK